MSDKQTYPNAGPNCDLSRYRTGEAPMVGDKVRLHGDCINGVRDEWPTCKLTIQRVYRSGEVEFPVPHRSIEKRALYAARFDLISRAHSPDAGKMVEHYDYCPFGPSGSRFKADRGTNCMTCEHCGQLCQDHVGADSVEQPAPEPKRFVAD